MSGDHLAPSHQRSARAQAERPGSGRVRARHAPGGRHRRGDEDLVTLRDNSRADRARWWQDLPRPSPAALIGVAVLVLIAWAAIHVSSQGDAVPFDDAPAEPADEQDADPGATDGPTATEDPGAGDTPAPDDDGSVPPAEASATPTEVTVFVSGAVADPGVVQLPSGARVIDALDASGGTTEDADPAALNLARPLTDGEQIHVPTPGEEPRPDQADQAEAAAPEGAADGDTGGHVDINTASASELEALPGVGPAIAQRIVDHRDLNGPFRSVDDLLGVSGIGPATLENLRSQATV